MLHTLEVLVSLVSVQDMTGASMDKLEQVEPMIDEALFQAMSREFEEVDNVSVSVARFDSIEAWDEDGNSINPDGDIAQRVARVINGIKPELVDIVTRPVPGS